MKENISMATAIIAIIIAVIAIASGFIIKPDFSIGAGSIDENELADSSVTSEKIMDGTIVDDDINDIGISKISDGAVTMGDLSSSVLAAMAGAGIIVDNSITSQKIMNETITANDISNLELKRSLNEILARVILTPFPFTDLTSRVNRPGIILSSKTQGDTYILGYISTQFNPNLDKPKPKRILLSAIGYRLSALNDRFLLITNIILIK